MMMGVDKLQARRDFPKDASMSCDDVAVTPRRASRPVTQGAVPRPITTHDTLPTAAVRIADDYKREIGSA